MSRECGRCGVDISERDVRAKYCSERCAKMKPCQRCGGFKGKDTKQGGRFCPPCQEVVDSKDYGRDLDRQRSRKQRLAVIEAGAIVRRRNDAPEGQKWCAQCQRFLPLTSFAPNKAKPSAYCIPCAKDYNHTATLKRVYGITPDRYDELLDLQDGRCAICLTRPRKRRLAVDHDHETGAIRGLLCTRCNHGILGKAHDSEQMLSRALSYLRKPPGVTGLPITEHDLAQGDLDFYEEQIPFLKDGEVAVHATRPVVAVSARTMLALAQAAGYALVVSGKRIEPPRQNSIDDELLLRQVHASYHEQVSA